MYLFLQAMHNSTYIQANNATRKKGFKKGVEVEDARRRRNDTTVQIRKEKKEDQIQKRRAVSVYCSRMLIFIPLL